jgi:hypothetical protein
VDNDVALLAEAYQLAQQDLYTHLLAAEYLADDDWTDELTELVRELLPELAMIIRTVLAAHRTTERGECLTCERPWPCQLVSTVHGLVKHPDHHFVQVVDRTARFRA